MSVIANATLLIYLAKIGKLALLKQVFGSIIIPEEVKKEVVDKGKQLGELDAFVIEQALLEGWIKVEKAEEIWLPVKLHVGEEAVLALAKQKEISTVLLDELSARIAAKILELTPKGTVYVLFKALTIDEITLEEFIDSLAKLLEQGFRLKEEIYLEAIKKAKEIVLKKK